MFRLRALSQSGGSLAFTFGTSVGFVASLLGGNHNGMAPKSYVLVRSSLQLLPKQLEISVVWKVRTNIIMDQWMESLFKLFSEILQYSIRSASLQICILPLR